MEETCRHRRTLPQVLEGFARQTVLLEDLQGPHQLVVIHQQSIAILARSLFSASIPRRSRGGKHLVGLVLGQAEYISTLQPARSRSRDSSKKSMGRGMENLWMRYGA